MKFGGKSKIECRSSSVSMSRRVPDSWTCLLYSMVLILIADVCEIHVVYRAVPLIFRNRAVGKQFA